MLTIVQYFSKNDSSLNYKNMRFFFKKITIQTYKKCNRYSQIFFLILMPFREKKNPNTRTPKHFFGWAWGGGGGNNPI